jgi:hypothetical protein
MSRSKVAVLAAMAALAIAVGVYYATRTTTSSYDSAIAYTQTRAPFTPKRTIVVSTAPQLENALDNLRPGDLVRAVASFTVRGMTTISRRLSSWAVVDLTGHSVKFVYSGGENEPAVWLDNPSYIRIYGGDATTSGTGGTCILAHGSQHVVWWGFTAHDCGASGFSALTVNAPVSDDDFQGTIWKVGQHIGWDSHTEKGTGQHCAGEFADNGGGHAFTNNRMAFYCHDIPTGAAFAFGVQSPAVMTGNLLYLRAVNLTNVAEQQTGGNGVELWGYTNKMGLNVKYLQVSDAQGYGLFTGGVFSGQTCKGVTVEHGIARNTNRNPRYADQNPWDTRCGVVYKKVTPTP